MEREGGHSKEKHVRKDNHIQIFLITSTVLIIWLDPDIFCHHHHLVADGNQPYWCCYDMNPCIQHYMAWTHPPCFLHLMASS